MTLVHKLRSRSGETLAETLCAMLIVLLASAVFATMTVTASRLNASAAERDQALYRGVAAAEAANGEGTRGKVSVTVDGVERPLFHVVYYGSETIISYRYDKGGRS